MSTRPVSIPIVADDQTQAVMAQVQARVSALSSTTNEAGSKMAYSFREARGAAALLSEEVGVRLNRHLQSAIASSQLLGPLLQGAFSIVAVVGFLEVAKGIYDRLTDIKQKEDEIAHQIGLAETFHKIAEEVAKVQTAFENVGKTQVQITLAAQAEAQFRLVSAQLLAQQQDAMAKQLAAQKGFSPLVGGSVEAITAGPSAAKADLAMITAFREKAQSNRETISLLSAEFQKASADFAKAVKDAADKANKDATDAASKMEQFIRKVDELKTKLKPEGISETRVVGNVLGNFGPGWHIPSPDDMLAQASPNASVAEKYLETFKAMRQIYIDTMPPAERLAFEIARLNTLFGDNRGETYQRALKALKDRFDESHLAAQKLGEAFGKALEEGMLMGRSWEDVLKSLIVTIAQLIIKMTILKELQSSSFGQTGVGGFLSSFLGAFTGGHASGGFLPPGSWGIAGENGPEAIFAGSSGLTVMPNSAGGGRVVYQDFRGAVVTDDLLRRAEGAAMIRQSHAQAIAEARAAVGEDYARGRTAWR